MGAVGDLVDVYDGRTDKCRSKTVQNEESGSTVQSE
jgi:hypothetical protein